MHSGESIKVFVRVRPPDPNLGLEVDQGACLEASTQMTITVHCKPEPRIFTFDHVAGMETTQVKLINM
jgi:kinesin family protein 15